MLGATARPELVLALLLLLHAFLLAPVLTILLPVLLPVPVLLTPLLSTALAFVLFFFLIPPVFALLLPVLLPTLWLEPLLGLLLPAPKTVSVLTVPLPALVHEFVLLGTSTSAHSLTCLFVPLFGYPCLPCAYTQGV